MLVIKIGFLVIWVKDLTTAPGIGLCGATSQSRAQSLANVQHRSVLDYDCVCVHPVTKGVDVHVK